MYSWVSPGNAPASSAKYLLVSLVSSSASAKDFTNGSFIRRAIANKPPAALISLISSAILSWMPLASIWKGFCIMLTPISNPRVMAVVIIMPTWLPRTLPATAPESPIPPSDPADPRAAGTALGTRGAGVPPRGTPLKAFL